MPHHTHALGVFVVVSTFALGACSGGVVDDEVASDEGALTEGAVAGEVALGTELVTTVRVNFRQGPSTNSRVMRVLAAGAMVITVNRTTPSGAFYNVKSGTQEGWVHGSYLSRSGGSFDSAPPLGNGACARRKLTFSADDFPIMPAAGAAYVWGANATGGESAPYSNDFLSLSRKAHGRGLQVFAYLEGPCGDTGGVDDGERNRCANIHNAFNADNAPNTPDTAAARWKPYTLRQLTMSGRANVDYCEIDNLSNAVTIPLNPLLRQIKAMYDAGEVHCRIVLKNVEASDIDAIRVNVAPTVAEANFLAPFHIFEADDTSQKSALDAAMTRLKGQGAKTIISLDTNHYGSALTHDTFVACP